MSAAILLLDQWTKSVASDELILYQRWPVIPGFNLTLMHNSGAAFSFLSEAGGWQRWFFIASTSIISVIIFIWMMRTPSNRHFLLAALGLVLGGAMGNLWDRLHLGYVVDFIEIYYQNFYWPTFNLADAAITVGAIMLMIDGLFFNDTK